MGISMNKESLIIANNVSRRDNNRGHITLARYLVMAHYQL